jgi:hypothetical protein
MRGITPDVTTADSLSSPSSQVTRRRATRGSSECCADMQRDLDRRCPEHHDRFDCADMVIHKTESGNYGLIIHDGGSSFYAIKFCPWCGAKI